MDFHHQSTGVVTNLFCAAILKSALSLHSLSSQSACFHLQVVVSVLHAALLWRNEVICTDC